MKSARHPVCFARFFIAYRVQLLPVFIRIFIFFWRRRNDGGKDFALDRDDAVTADRSLIAGKTSQPCQTRLL